jgi:hypothetical protein
MEDRKYRDTIACINKIVFGAEDRNAKRDADRNAERS